MEIETMEIETMNAISDLRERRAALLDSVRQTAQMAYHTLVQWQALGVAVAPDGDIGIRWAEAEVANQTLIVGLGQPVPDVLSALGNVIVAAHALQAAGAGLEPPLDLLPGLPSLPN